MGGLSHHPLSPPSTLCVWGAGDAFPSKGESRGSLLEDSRAWQTTGRGRPCLCCVELREAPPGRVRCFWDFGFELSVRSLGIKEGWWDGVLLGSNICAAVTCPGWVQMSTVAQKRF